ncbi:MAG: PglZ domain-containing protein, partial [Planctomycetaceae bacterium]
MTLSEHIHRLLTRLLDEKQVVVWYDQNGDLRDLAVGFRATNCRVVDASASVLRARREADRIFRGLNDPDDPELRSASLLIYCPRARGKQEEERCRDPFEVFAVCGAAFGDKPNETVQSLARQAMPDRTAEIDRVFEQGEPSLNMLDGLKAGMSYPLVKDCLGTDFPLEVAAQILCIPGTIEKLADAPGAVAEALRLLQAEFGYEPPSRAQKASSKLEPLAHHVLLSEFAFDLDGPLDPSLAELSIAPAEHRERIFALCDRMRRSDDTREGYIGIAQHVEAQLQVRQRYKDHLNLGKRDTFPFEERSYLDRLRPLADVGKLDEARQVIADRRQSIWSSLGERAVLWKTAERCIEFLAAIETTRPHLPAVGATVREHLRAYTDRERGLWRVDRGQRLVEQAAASCAEDDEVEPLVEVCRQRYREIAALAQSRFLKAVEQQGWPPDEIPRLTQTFDRHVAPLLRDGTKVVYLLVDSMRYEMARDLGAALEDLGAVRVEAVTGVLPAVTMIGMAALMPGADGTLRLVEKGDTLVPSVGGASLPDSKERM